MAKKRKRNNRKTPKTHRKRRHSQQAIAPTTVTNTPSQVGSEITEEGEYWYSHQWRESRAGSRAGRGFHFQDAVGAWFASRLASGDLAIDSLTPEGFDDLQLDGPEPVQVEVKSRQGRLGRFPVAIAAKHIADAWRRHVGRFGTSRRLIVALEQGIEGWEHGTDDEMTEVPVARLANEVDGLDSSLHAHIASQAQSPTTLDNLMAGTTLLICSWSSINRETQRHLAQLKDLPPAALRMIAQTLRSVVADAVDANAQARFEDRASLERTFIVDKINSASELIDVESLEGAIASGICSPFNNEPIETGDTFYEGVSTQPGHVGAGLVVPRPNLVFTGDDRVGVKPGCGF